MKYLLALLLSTVSLHAQITLSGEKWPWEDKWSDPTRGSILLARVGDMNIATLTYEATNVFMVSQFDTTYKAVWNHIMPAPDHSVSAHIMASDVKVSAFILTFHDDTLGIHGISIDRTTGAIIKQGLVASVASGAIRRPIFSTSPDGKQCALVQRNEGDPSTVILFDEDLQTRAVYTNVDIPQYKIGTMLRPLVKWNADNFYLATASPGDSIDISIIEIGRNKVNYSQRGIPFTSGDDLDVDDCRIEFVSGQNDTYNVIVQERDGKQTNALVRHQLSLANNTSSFVKYQISERDHPVDAFTRTLIVGDTAYVVLERFSALYKRQMATNESISIYTVGDGSITRFDPTGARWSVPVLRTTDKSIAGTSETKLFGLTPAVIGVHSGTVTNVLWCDEIDDFIIAQDYDASSGKITQRTPLAEVDGPTYCFLEQWIIMPEHRCIWAPIGTNIKLFRY